MDAAVRNPNPMCGTSERSYMWCNFEPCGMICASITWGLVIYAMFVVNFRIIACWLGFGLAGSALAFFYNYISLTCLVVHLKAMITDPGSVSSLAEPLEDEIVESLEEGNLESEENKRTHKMCRRCRTFKPQRAHHCSICQRCIIKMDHHCPWINNCVGIGNQKFFIQFVCCVFLLSIFSLVLTVSRMIACMGKGGQHHSVHGHTNNSVIGPSFCATGADGGALILLLLLESTLFGFFTFCMGLDQWQSFSTGISQIDRLQGSSQVENNDFNEVFGGGKSFRIDWLLPTNPCWSSEAWDKIVGYHIPPHKQKQKKWPEYEMVKTESAFIDQSSGLEAMSNGSSPTRYRIPGEVSVQRDGSEFMQRKLSQHSSE